MSSKQGPREAGMRTIANCRQAPDNGTWRTRTGEEGVA
jgi:hypothetical protein